MVVPGLYGYVSATKWLVDMEITRFADFDAYWTPRGWAEQAPIKISSRIDVPGSFQKFDPGQIVLAGVAWAQHTGIDRVEVSIDGGTWQDAELAQELSIDTWRQWRYTWDAANAAAGTHEVKVRATGKDGVRQTEEQAPPRPDGATGWHSIVFGVN
jgi:sulfite oxidase